MAEYIDKNKLNKKKKYLLQTQEMPFPKSEYFIKVDDFHSMPTADVIERSKIDKAIEEIKQDMIAHSGTGEEVIQAYRDGLKKALEYLDNIGE